ncbi:MAG: flagellar biosynthetic protein FliR [Terriglobales bacterium]
MEISLQQLISSVLIIGLRVSGLMLFAPFFGNATVPPRIKAVLIIAITAVLYPVYGPHLQAVSISNWPLLVASETVIGIAMGITTNIVFEAVQVAGQALSIQMGYSLVNILDPSTQVESTVIAFLHQSIALLIFLALDVHHWILRAVANSFDYLPPGTATLNPLFIQALLHEGAVVLDLGIQIAAPVLSATLLADIVLGLMGKSSPQMPLMLLGPAVKSMMGVMILSVTMRFWPHLFERYFANSIAYSEHMLHLAH